MPRASRAPPSLRIFRAYAGEDAQRRGSRSRRSRARSRPAVGHDPGMRRRLRRLWRWMSSTGAAEPWPEAAQVCPRCGRAIPGGIRHTSPPWIIPGPLAATDAELIRLCPIDGSQSRAHPPHDRAVADLQADVKALAASLSAEGEGSWSHMLASTLDHPTEAERLTYMGHGLALLLERGPWRREPLKSQAKRIRQLLADTVVKWPARRT